ncbi:hypothetical protein BC834DRAFT_795724, partial [Gloeopeniophorella convolvens]
TEADLEILHENLDEYRVSDAPDRALLVNRVLGDLTALRDEGDDFDKGEARTVRSKVRKWFDNRSRKALARFMRFTRKWSARNVFYQENRDKI